MLIFGPNMRPFAGFFCMRLIQGLAGGVTFPAMNVLISKWALKEEKSLVTSMVFGGKLSYYLTEP